MSKIECYVIGLGSEPCTRGQPFALEKTIDSGSDGTVRAFRSTHLRTNVTDFGHVFIGNVLFGSAPQLISEADAYHFSLQLAEETAREFDADIKKRMRRAGLKDLSARAVQKYVDDHELSPPDPSRFDTATITITPGQIIRVEGRFTQRAPTHLPISILLVGWATR